MEKKWKFWKTATNYSDRPKTPIKSYNKLPDNFFIRKKIVIMAQDL